ncbi:unnamed protein product, partial [Ectocarpus sp. 12 AP-2014]
GQPPLTVASGGGSRDVLAVGRPRRLSRCAVQNASPDGVDEWKAAQVEVADHVATECETWCDLAGCVQVRKEGLIRKITAGVDRERVVDTRVVLTANGAAYEAQWNRSVARPRLSARWWCIWL